MIAILISCGEKECGNIINEIQSILVRKTMPKCDLPIDVYIYCKPTKRASYIAHLENKVVAKFTLSRVEEIYYECGNNGISVDGYKWFYTEEIDLVMRFEKATCLNEYELFNYLQPKEAGGSPCGYAWHISNLVIFDKPKELNEFKVWGIDYPTGIIEPLHDCNVYYKKKLKPLTRAPRTWCYVEVE